MTHHPKLLSVLDLLEENAVLLYPRCVERVGRRADGHHEVIVRQLEVLQSQQKAPTEVEETGRRGEESTAKNVLKFS